MKIVKIVLNWIGKLVLGVFLVLLSAIMLVLVPIGLFFLGIGLDFILIRDVWKESYIRYKAAFNADKSAQDE